MTLVKPFLVASDDSLQQIVILMQANLQDKEPTVATTRPLPVVVAMLVVTGCSVPRALLPQTDAALQQGASYSYRPLDPLSANLQHALSVPVTNCRILELFPDETVRLAIGQLDASGNISYGVAKAGYQGNRYTVVLDYTKTDTRSLSATDTQGTGTSGADSIAGRQVPTYVGIGLRLSANLTVNSGTVDLANLIAIGAAAQAKQLSGTLVIQTMGISGESVASAIPIPSEISESSIQNALVAIGTIKSKIYDDRTSISPRIIGIYNIFGSDANSFNQFFASILSNPPSVTERENSSHCPSVTAASTSPSKPGGASNGSASGAESSTTESSSPASVGSITDVAATTADASSPPNGQSKRSPRAKAGALNKLAGESRRGAGGATSRSPRSGRNDSGPRTSITSSGLDTPKPRRIRGETLVPRVAKSNPRAIPG